MKFEDKEDKLPFKVEIRKKNSLQNNTSNIGNQQKQKQQEVKNQEIQNTLNNLKKTLEVKQNTQYVNPLIGVFQKNLEEAEKKKILDAEKKKEQLIAKRLYEEYKKRKEQRIQMMQNSPYGPSRDNKRSMLAPRFSTQQQQQTSRPNTGGAWGTGGTGNNTYNNNNTHYNNRPPGQFQKRPPFATGVNNNTMTNNRLPGQNNTLHGGPRNFMNNVFSSGMAKQYINTPIHGVPMGTKKKNVENKEKKNNKPLKEKQDNFDWRKYIDTDDVQSTGQKIKRTKNNNLKNKNKKQKSIVLQSGVSLTSLSKLTSIQIDDLIASGKSLGVRLSNLQEILDNDLVCLILEMHNFTCSFYGVEEEFKEFIKINLEDCKDKRPPVVCVLGHVDHGKTSLLDSIKKTKVVELEAGGITQNIALYQLKEYGNTIFIDTPGHSVFSTMRKVGVKLTDIIILIIAADDGLQEQTREIIEVLKHYNKKIIICITKIDKMESTFSPNMIYNELSTRYEIVPIEYGGDVPVLQVSNKTGDGIKALLDTISDMSGNMHEDLACNNERLAIGIVVNSYLEPGFGVVTYILLQHGTLKVGDEFISGNTKGKVRFLFTPNSVKKCNSSNIIKVVGFTSMPVAGDDFVVIDKLDLRNEIFDLRNKTLIIDPNIGQNNNILLNTLTKKKISILLKADTAASLASLSDALKALSNNQTYITIFSSNIGVINQNDLAKAREFELVVVGFNVKIEKDNNNQGESVQIISSNIIYHILDGVMDLTKRKEIIIKEEECGRGEIIELFTFEKIVIGGCKIISGSIFHSDNYICEIFRNKKSIFKGKINSMKRTNNKIKEAKNGTEVGIIFDNFTNLLIKDEVICYKIVEETIILQD